MIKSIQELDLNKKYSYADYLTWQFNEYVELIKGKVFKMSPAPSRKHQSVAWNLTVQIGNYFKEKGCQAFFAPFDVKLVDHRKSTPNEQIFTVVQPDVFVVCDESKLNDQGCTGAPDWIIEIISPSTRKRDLETKYALYAESGVREYWVIQPNDDTVTVFILDDSGGRYQFKGLYPAEAEVSVQIFPDLTVNMRAVFGID